jgi:hypothetical protein
MRILRLAYGQFDSDSTLAGTTRANNINAGWTVGGSTLSSAFLI